ncbi:MAG: 5,10-methylenetetrahydromethanopterin reductase [Halobacteriales archaeon]
MWGVELTPEHPIEDVVTMAETAESAGFDAVFASCHYNNRDPFITLDRIAAATDHVHLGPGIANPYESHPVALASRMATLAEVSDGRTIFGIGPGDTSTLENLGVDRDRPLRRVLETFKIAQRLWAGERIKHDGTFLAQDAGLNYTVDPIPVYVGAQGPHMIRMSAKHADGVLVNAAHPDDFAWASDQVETGMADRPADRGPFDFAAFASVSVAETATAAREAARPPVAFIAAGAAPPVIDRHGIDDERAAEIGELIAAGEFTQAFEAVTEPMLDAFCITGTPADVADRIDAILEHADSIVAGSPLGPDRTAAIRLLAEAFARSNRA